MSLFSRARRHFPRLWTLCKKDELIVGGGQHICRKYSTTSTDNWNAEAGKIGIQKIAVIGGGAGGLSFCLQFFDKIKQREQELQRFQLELWLFERSEQVGPGMAHGRHSEHADVNSLNTTKDGLSPRVGHFGDFSVWLQKNKDHTESSTQFPPRHHYGQYLNSLAEKLQHEAETNSPLKFNIRARTTVTKLRKHNDGFVICYDGDKSQGELFADHVVLCVGHMPSDTYRHFIGNPRYGHDVEGRMDIFRAMKDTARIGIIGTKLTAYDVAFELYSRHHIGPIWMGSRTGLLSAVFNPIRIQMYRDGTKRRTTFDSMTELINAEKTGKQNGEMQLKYLPVDPHQPPRPRRYVLSLTAQKDGGTDKLAIGIETGHPEKEQGELVEKNGKIPLMKLHHFTRDVLHGTSPITVDQLVMALYRELKINDFMTTEEIMIYFRSIDCVEEFENEIKKCAQYPIRDWHLVMFALYPIVPNLWRRMPSEEKQKYKSEHWNSIFSTFFTSISLESANLLSEMLRTEQLRILSEVEHIEWDLESRKFIMHGSIGSVIKGTKRDMTICVDFLLNATGPGTIASNIPLIADLIDAGLAIEHPFGGICMDEETHQVLPKIEPARLYVIGELTKGHLLLTASQARLAGHAHTVADQIVSDLLGMVKAG